MPGRSSLYSFAGDCEVGEWGLSCSPKWGTISATRKRHLILLALFLGLAGPAQAERADRAKPINLESDSMRVDDAQKISVFEGKVVMTQGTLTIRADRITVRQDKEGHQYGSASGNLATFRQKRDGADEYIEGEAERIEYDGKMDKVEFFSRARLKREPADEVRGNYISYDSRTEYFTVTGGAAPSASGSSAARVHAVIQPRSNADGAEKTSPSAAPKR
jgi:lipopolysaccharide export system protein LptA